MSKSTFVSVREFLDHVGRKRLKARGAYAQVCHGWILAGKISSRWVPIFIELYGADLPWHLFNTREAGPTEQQDAATLASTP